MINLFADRVGSTTSFKFSKIPYAKGIVVVKGVVCIIVTNEVVAACCQQMENAIYSYRNAEGREHTLNQVRVNWKDLGDNYKIIHDIHSLDN